MSKPDVVVTVINGETSVSFRTNRSIIVEVRDFDLADFYDADELESDVDDYYMSDVYTNRNIGPIN